MASSIMSRMHNKDNIINIANKAIKNSNIIENMNLCDANLAYECDNIENSRILRKFSISSFICLYFIMLNNYKFYVNCSDFEENNQLNKESNEIYQKEFNLTNQKFKSSNPICKKSDNTSSSSKNNQNTQDLANTKDPVETKSLEKTKTEKQKFLNGMLDYEETYNE